MWTFVILTIRIGLGRGALRCRTCLLIIKYSIVLLASEKKEWGFTKFIFSPCSSHIWDNWSCSLACRFSSSYLNFSRMFSTRIFLGSPVMPLPLRCMIWKWNKNHYVSMCWYLPFSKLKNKNKRKLMEQLAVLPWVSTGLPTVHCLFLPLSCLLIFLK